MSDMPDVAEAKQMILSGIKGYANTYIHDTLLPELVVQVEAGNVWAVPEVLQSILQSFLQNQPREVSRYDTSELTERELQVLEQMRSGAGNRLIAIALGISERTVKAHVSSILNKTGAPDRVRLIIGNRGQDETYEH
jgi:DNA-binding NarL/FixJ family response regulator